MGHALPATCLPSTSAGGNPLGHLISSSISDARPGQGVSSALDRALEALVVITRIAVDESSDWTTQHGLILSGSAVAVADDYFRTVLVDVATYCPLSKQMVMDLETRMEFVVSGSISDALRSSLHLTSFASAENVKTWTKRIAGYRITAAESAGANLALFERACHVRHCAIHAGGYVAAHNARVLGVEVGSWISISSPASVHEVVAVVAATLRAYNQGLFEHLLSRWITENILSGDWSADKVLFERIWQIFRSKSDLESARLQGRANVRSRPYDAYLVIRRAIRSRNAS